MKKTLITTICGFFSLCALFSVSGGAYAATYMKNSGGKLVFTNAPTSSTGSGSSLVKIENNQETVLKISKNSPENKEKASDNSESSETGNSKEKEKQERDKQKQAEDSGQDNNAQIIVEAD